MFTDPFWFIKYRNQDIRWFFDIYEIKYIQWHLVYLKYWNVLTLQVSVSVILVLCSSQVTVSLLAINMHLGSISSTLPQWITWQKCNYTLDYIFITKKKRNHNNFTFLKLPICKCLYCMFQCISNMQNVCSNFYSIQYQLQKEDNCICECVCMF